MGKRTAILRSLWLTALLIQIVLYYLSYPHLLAVVTHNRLPGNETVNVIGYDLIGIGAWCMFLLFLEERPLRDSKWMHYTSIGAFIVLAVCIALTNMNAWK